MLKSLSLLGLGLLEMIVVTLWTSSVAQARIVTSGIVTLINIFIWYYVLQAVVEDLGNISLIVWYAIGCAAGTMMGTWLSSHYGKQALKRIKSFILKRQYA